MKCYFFCGTFLFFLARADALELDERLRVEILQVSETKESMVLDQGKDAGLELGQHAKFSNLAGLVARGVLVRFSPGRSVWMIYQTKLPEEIKKNNPMILKISLPMPGTEKIFGAHKLREEVIGEKVQEILQEQAELAIKKFELTISSAMTGNYSVTTYEDVTRQRSYGHYGGITGAATLEYFTPWVSPFFQAAYTRGKGRFDENVPNKSDLMEFSLGALFHIRAGANEIGHIIPAFYLQGGLGRVVEWTDYSKHRQPQTSEADEFTGRTYSLQAGLGFKYNFSSEIGMRLFGEYYRREEEFSEGRPGWEHDKIVYGPRFVAGLSYRF